jgi:hypothetical protein
MKLVQALLLAILLETAVQVCWVTLHILPIAIKIFEFELSNFFEHLKI